MELRTYRHAWGAVGPGTRFSGFAAWVLWLAIHLVYIIGFKHRVTTLLHWAVSFIGRGRSERTVTAQQILARNIIRKVPIEDLPTLPIVESDHRPVA